MILLAVIVTRSSALSLQAKAGLPLGNQIVGWIVLGELQTLNKSLEETKANLYDSVFITTPIRPPNVSK
jgi:hypothetical protein